MNIGIFLLMEKLYSVSINEEEKVLQKEIQFMGGYVFGSLKFMLIIVFKYRM